MQLYLPSSLSQARLRLWLRALMMLALACFLWMTPELCAQDVLERVSTGAQSFMDGAGERVSDSVSAHVSERVDSLKTEVSSYVDENMWEIITGIAVLLIILSVIYYLVSAVIKFFLRYGIIIGVVLIIVCGLYTMV